MYKLNINPNSAQALERLGSISISPDSPTSVSFTVSGRHLYNTHTHIYIQSAKWPTEDDGPSNIREVVTDKGAKVIHCSTLYKLVERLTSPISFGKI